MAKLLVLLSQLPDDQNFAKYAAEVAGLQLEVADDAKHAAEKIGSGNVAAVFVDSSEKDRYQEFEDAVQKNVGLFSDKITANFMHFISDQDLQQVTYLFQSPIFGHYIRRNYEDASVAGRRYGHLVKATLESRAFGLANILPEGTKIQIIKFNNTSQKQEGVEAVKNFLLAAKFKSRMATVIANAVDELIMNAMFDAPVDELGKQIYVNTPRNAMFELMGEAEVEMHVGYDKDYVAISAVDHFGSLDKNRLFAHISKRYVEEEYKVRTTVAGAGIGLATVFRSGGSFFFASESSSRTEVTVFFKRTDNFRAFKDQFRFISTQFYF